MEIIFPAKPGLSGFFLIGFRKTAENMTERTGTVVLKRTYDIDPVTQRLTPAETPLPIFMQDHADNVVENSDFALPEGGGEAPLGWQADTATIAVESGAGVEGNALRVTGSPNGRVIQTLTFDEPLGGRQFFFSLSAQSLFTTARIENVQLEVEGSAPICVMSRNLGTAFTRFSASGTWPARCAGN